MGNKHSRSSRHRTGRSPGGRPALGVALLTDERDLAALRGHGSLVHRDYAGYLASCERDMRSMRASGKVVAEAFDLGEYLALCREAGLDPGDAASRARYAALVCEEGDPLAYRGEPIDEFVAVLARRERARRLSSRIEGHLARVPAGQVMAARKHTADLLLWLLSREGPGLHVLTCLVEAGRGDPLEVSAEIEVRPNKTLLRGEDPLVLAQMLVLARAVRARGSLIMRFRTRRTDPATDLPLEIVRSWSIRDGELRSLSGTETHAAFCVDARTGGPLIPEPAVEYADAPSFREGLDEPGGPDERAHPPSPVPSPALRPAPPVRGAERASRGGGRPAPPSPG
ncbi:hypothetical protein [Planomonospora parontospora]|uniref:hypothetical protein n=1 Tax=Planomonospora parontospora TaxID=58119 RepID=UPI0016713220|nr:hypothetical protein [Planomonospora parontospora]GGL44427.1 hypothetical protein GCM10014719_52230 [Planomonospora parontospora subsp. antibiotica]GII18620.1 hypothetical protein Ppa05_53460 [Planomonospora parontospora subsp. antibiotica]